MTTKKKTTKKRERRVLATLRSDGWIVDYGSEREIRFVCYVGSTQQAVTIHLDHEFAQAIAHSIHVWLRAEQNRVNYSLGVLKGEVR